VSVPVWMLQSLTGPSETVLDVEHVLGLVASIPHRSV